MTGTKVGCGEGGCGSCVVHISYLQHGDVMYPLNDCVIVLLFYILLLLL